MKKVIISILTAAVVLGGLPASFAGPRPKAPNNTTFPTTNAEQWQEAQNAIHPPLLYGARH